MKYIKGIEKNGVLIQISRISDIMDDIPINRIVCDDAYTFLQTLPSNSIQCFLTSPPYWQQRDYGAGGIGNEDEVSEYLNQLMNVVREMHRVCHDSGIIIVNLGDVCTDRSFMLIPYQFAIRVISELRMILVNTITWVKDNPQPRHDARRLVTSTEPFFIFAKSTEYYYNPDAYNNTEDDKDLEDRMPSAKKGQKYLELIAKAKTMTPEQKQLGKKAVHDAIERLRSGEITDFRMRIKEFHAKPFGGLDGGYMRSMDRDGFVLCNQYGRKIKKDVIHAPVETAGKGDHPAKFPEDVVEELILLTTHPGDLVCDPFAGSGTTCAVTKRLRRKWLGIEINPEYCQCANDRVRQTPVFGDLSVFMKPKNSYKNQTNLP